MTTHPGRRYAIVTPARNEEGVIERTIESVLAQTEPPSAWIIADDASTDDTAAVVQRYADSVDFMRLLRIGDSRGVDGDTTHPDRLRWAAEAIAFNRGVAELNLDDYDFIVKLDGDLAFGPDFFSSLLDEFARDSQLGLAGGYCYALFGGKRVLEWVPETHVRGATKMYRVACFRAIGGIEPVYAWDTIDELRAQMRGWRTRSFPYPVDHLRPTGSKNGQMRGEARMGRGAYLLGYHPLFLLARAFKLAFVKPYVLGAMAFLLGYLGAMIERPPKSADDELITYLRKQQMTRLKGFGNLVEVRSLFGRGIR